MVGVFEPTETCTVMLITFSQLYYNSCRLLFVSGLMAGWFDACTSYVSSIDRVNALQFTDPIRTTTSTFTVLQGNPKNFDPLNLQNAVIGL